MALRILTWCAKLPSYESASCLFFPFPNACQKFFSWFPMSSRTSPSWTSLPQTKCSERSSLPLAHPIRNPRHDDEIEAECGSLVNTYSHNETNDNSPSRLTPCPCTLIHVLNQHDAKSHKAKLILPNIQCGQSGQLAPTASQKRCDEW